MSRNCPVCGKSMEGMWETCSMNHTEVCSEECAMSMVADKENLMRVYIPNFCSGTRDAWYEWKGYQKFLEDMDPGYQYALTPSEWYGGTVIGYKLSGLTYNGIPLCRSCGRWFLGIGDKLAKKMVADGFPVSPVMYSEIVYTKLRDVLKYLTPGERKMLVSLIRDGQDVLGDMELKLVEDADDDNS